MEAEGRNRDLRPKVEIPLLVNERCESDAAATIPTMSADFYARPMVIRIKEIFDDPVPPRQVIEDQFDGAQDDLIRTATKPWHEIDQSDYWHYLLDLCYVDLQQDLFDYLFPAFLIRWWEGQLTRLGGPASECDFYRAIDGGQVFTKMMDESRREQVLRWMTDAYIEGVDAWSNELSVEYNSSGPNNLNGPLIRFNALGQSVPVIGPILEQLGNIQTIGRAQWWLVFATSIVLNVNQRPAAVPSWTPYRGGGVLWTIKSATSISDHGFLPENLEALASFLDYERLTALVEQSADLIPSFPHGDWARSTWEDCLGYPQRVAKRLENLFYLLSKPDLGGSMTSLLDYDD
jgi:hypothetical protein